jgi:hypothetical protein
MSSAVSQVRQDVDEAKRAADALEADVEAGELSRADALTAAYALKAEAERLSEVLGDLDA